MEKVLTGGAMGESTEASGSKVFKKVSVPSGGPTDRFTRECIMAADRTAKENSNIPMVFRFGVILPREKSTAELNTLPRDWNIEKASGMEEFERSGPKTNPRNWTKRFQTWPRGPTHLVRESNASCRILCVVGWPCHIS